MSDILAVSDDCLVPGWLFPSAKVEKVEMFMVIRFWALLVLLMTTAQANGQVSVGSLRSSIESLNLEAVTLRGVVHLKRQNQQQLGGRCGGTAFVLAHPSGIDP